MSLTRPCLTPAARGFAAAAAGAGWWEIAKLRRLAGAERVLGYARGPKEDAPEWAFLACDTTAAPFRAARRSVVVVKIGPEPATIVTFDFATPAGASWRQLIETAGASQLSGNSFRAGPVHHTVLLPGGGDPLLDATEGGVIVTSRKQREDAILLHVAQAGAVLPVELIWTIDLAGVRVGDRIIAFHAGLRMAHQPVFFDVDEGAHLKFLLTGLAPGSWDIWWKGWLEQSGLWVAPHTGTLYFEGPAGGYYFSSRG